MSRFRGDARSWHVPSRVPPHLPLLDRFLEECCSGGVPLAGHAALLIQHQMGTIVPMVKGLLALGLDSRNVWWVDIPYSANVTVRRHLVGLGIPAAHFMPATHRLSEPYRTGQVGRVAAALAEIDNALPAEMPLLVLDDGAYVLQALAANSVAVARPMKIVEQTTRGIMHIREDKGVCAVAGSSPVVNVAESEPKRVLEGPCIGRSIWESVHRRIDADFDASASPRVLVVGFGVVGSAVAEALVRVAGLPKEHVYVADRDAAARGRAVRAAFPIWDLESMNASSDRHGYDLVVGCSGHPAFRPEHVSILSEGAVLASASSGDEEFSRHALLEAADAVERRGRSGGTGHHLVHEDLRIRLGRRSFTLANSGFPVNFDGRVNMIPPEYMQATRIAMLGGAIQSAGSRTGGVQPLATSVARWIMDNCPTTNHLLASHEPGGPRRR